MISTLSNIQSDQLFWILIAVGVLVGICAIFFISIMSSWAMKETLDRAIPLLIFAVVAGASVYTIGSRVLHTSPQTQASAVIRISEWTVKETGLVTEITFKTSTPANAYLKYKTPSGEVIPIVAVESTKKVTEHRFRTDRPIGKEGTMSVVADGNTYPMSR